MIPERYRPKVGDTVNNLSLVLGHMIRERLQELLNPFFHGLGEKLQKLELDASGAKWLQYNLLEMAKEASAEIFDRQLLRAEKAFLAQKVREESQEEKPE